MNYEYTAIILGKLLLNEIITDDVLNKFRSECINSLPVSFKDRYSEQGLFSMLIDYMKKSTINDLEDRKNILWCIQMLTKYTIAGINNGEIDKLFMESGG